MAVRTGLIPTRESADQSQMTPNDISNSATAEAGMSSMDVREVPVSTTDPISVGLLTGGFDRHYATDLTLALIKGGARVEVVGSDDLDGPEMRQTPALTFLVCTATDVRMSARQRDFGGCCFIMRGSYIMPRLRDRRFFTFCGTQSWSLIEPS